MITNFQTVQDALYALITVVGIAVVFALAIVAASALTERSKARNAHSRVTVAPTMAQQPTQTDDVRELVLR